MDAPTIHAEQAVFTSVPTSRSDGYQLVAASAGLNSEQRRALSQWGPSHDSLLDEERESINFHPLPENHFAIGLTRLGGIEHSKRGRQIYTQTLVLSRAEFNRFFDNPFEVVAAARRAGLWTIEQHIDSELPKLALSVEDVQAVDLQRMARLVEAGDWPRVAALISWALADEPLGVVGGERIDQWLAALFDGLPPRLRSEYSFASNLRFSLRRPFRIVALPDDPQQVRRFQRQNRATVFYMEGDQPTPPLHPWAETMTALIESGQWEQYAELFNDGQLARP